MLWLTGTKEPLVTSVEPWNSVRVTLKVSRESATLLQTLAQQQDPKLLDIGILSVQIEGSNPVGLDRPTEATSKLNATGDRVNVKVDSSVRSAANSTAHVGTCQSAVHRTVSHTSVSAVQEVTCSRQSGVTTSANLPWHPLVDQRTATTSSDDTACSWDPFGYNGLSVDPFQFSADDLLTRMLADVPAPKRRQRIRKGSATLSTHTPFLLSNPMSFTVHGDCSSKVQPSNAPYSVSCGTTFGIPSGTQSHAPLKTAHIENDRMGLSSGKRLSSPYSTHVSDLYSVNVDNCAVSSVSSHLLCSHPHQSISSAAGMMPLSLDSVMTVSNRAIMEARSADSDQPPVKRRHVKSRSLTGNHSTIRDVCNEGAVGDSGDASTPNHVNAVQATQMHLPPAAGSRSVGHSPRMLWSDAQQGHLVLPARYPNVDAYRFRLPCQQSCSWTHSNSSYMYSDVPVTGALPLVPDVQKPFSVAGSMAARPSFTPSLRHHSKCTVLLLVCVIFAFCRLIITIFSPLQSEMISTHVRNTLPHLTLIVLLHYLVRCCFVKTHNVSFTFL